MKIKVCGITSVDQLIQLHELGADYAGLIFYEGSKRFVANKIQKETYGFQNTDIKKIGIFVNADFDTILNAIKDYGLYAVQLHGDETDEFCMELMDQTKVIKVFRIVDEQNIDALVEPFQNVCDYFMLDNAPVQLQKDNNYGGTGKKFDWKILKKATINKPFFLSGGIGEDDAEKIKNLNHPFLFAIDINSRFEIAPGVKNISKVQNFIKQIRNE